MEEVAEAVADLTVNDPPQQNEAEEEDVSNVPLKRELKPVRRAPAPPKPVRPPPPIRKAPTVDEAAIDPAKEEDWTEIEQYNILNTAGVDKEQRAVIVFAAANMPDRKGFDLDKLLRYMQYCFDKVVEADYSIVYLHNGLSSKNKPGVSWLRKVYSAFDRKYKKNLKAVYVVHSTMFVRFMLKLCQPFISQKFGKKITFVPVLSELEQYVHLNQVEIPESVKKHDRKVVAEQKALAAGTDAEAAPPKTVFGAKLEDMEAVVPESGLPFIVQDTIQYLVENGLDVEGIFRRSANAMTITTLKKSINAGERVDFAEHSDIHIPAVLLKAFLRELEEPLLTYNLYQEFLALDGLDDDATKVAEFAQFVSKLPPRNQAVFRSLCEFLDKVAQNSDVNKMTFSNIAIVFGPNLIWSMEQTANLQAMATITRLTQYVLAHQAQVFENV